MITKDITFSRRLRNFSAFSLVELMLVMTIVVVMMSLAVPAWQSISQGSSVRGAVTTGSSLVHGARATALLQGAGSVLLVDNTYDEKNPERFLRRMIVAQQTNLPDGTKQWIAEGAVSLLPKGSMFSPDYSAGYTKMNFDLSKKVPQDGTTGSEFICYRFDGAGQIVDNSGKRAQFVVLAGFADNGQLRVRNESSRDGFIIRKPGRITYFQDVNQITKP